MALAIPVCECLEGSSDRKMRGNEHTDTDGGFDEAYRFAFDFVEVVSLE